MMRCRVSGPPRPLDCRVLGRSEGGGFENADDLARLRGGDGQRPPAVRVIGEVGVVRVPGASDRLDDRPDRVRICSEDEALPSILGWLEFLALLRPGPLSSPGFQPGSSPAAQSGTLRDPPSGLVAGAACSEQSPVSPVSTVGCREAVSSGGRVESPEISWPVQGDTGFLGRVNATVSALGFYEDTLI
jgi:hypothetical protein